MFRAVRLVDIKCLFVQSASQHVTEDEIRLLLACLEQKDQLIKDQATRLARSALKIKSFAWK